MPSILLSGIQQADAASASTCQTHIMRLFAELQARISPPPPFRPCRTFSARERGACMPGNRRFSRRPVDRGAGQSAPSVPCRPPSPGLGTERLPGRVLNPRKSIQKPRPTCRQIACSVRWGSVHREDILVRAFELRNRTGADAEPIRDHQAVRAKDAMVRFPPRPHSRKGSPQRPSVMTRQSSIGHGSGECCRHDGTSHSCPARPLKQARALTIGTSIMIEGGHVSPWAPADDRGQGQHPFPAASSRTAKQIPAP